MEPTLDNPLVARLLDELLAEGPALADSAYRLLAPVATSRDTLRQRLLDDGQIVRLDRDLPSGITLAAVDGGSVRQHLYAADLMVAVAASATGMISDTPLPLGQRHWAQIRPHEADNDRLLAAAMASLEVTLLAELTHSLRILDGSHGTPVIALSTALSAPSVTVAHAAAELVTDEVLAALAGLADPDQRLHQGEVVALPKADSAHVFTDLYQDRYGLQLPGGDRFLAAQVLEPGEMLYPRPAVELARLHAPIPEQAAERVQRISAELDEAITPLREAAQRRELLVSYVKPHTAATVIKVEFRVSTPLPEAVDHTSDALTESVRIGRILSAETPGPHLQEPFAQYAVDLAAKSVSVGANALSQAMFSYLPAGSEDIVAYLARSYRTQTKPAPSLGRPSFAR